MNYCFCNRVKVLHTLLIVLAMLLGSCGGGGGDSSSGGGSGTIYAGTYTGTETYTISAPGTPVPPETGTYPLIIVVSSNGEVVITDSEGIQYTGNLTGESLYATGTSGQISVPGINCPATTITYTGTVSGNMITGSLNGTYNCTLNTGATLMITIAGKFSVTLQSAASATALGFNGNKRTMLESYLRDVVGR